MEGKKCKKSTSFFCLVVTFPKNGRIIIYKTNITNTLKTKIMKTLEQRILEREQKERNSFGWFMTYNKNIGQSFMLGKSKKLYKLIDSVKEHHDYLNYTEYVIVREFNNGKSKVTML